MDHYEKYTETKTVTRRKLIKTTCDRCNDEIPHSYWGSYNVREFGLSFAEGSSYPDGGSKEGWEVEDLCNSCISWLHELLIENSVKITKTDLDW